MAPVLCRALGMSKGQPDIRKMSWQGKAAPGSSSSSRKGCWVQERAGWVLAWCQDEEKATPERAGAAKTAASTAGPGFTAPMQWGPAVLSACPTWGARICRIPATT